VFFESNLTRTLEPLNPGTHFSRRCLVIEIDFKKGDGLIPAVIQDAATNEVLMVGYMNRESWEKTLETKRATFWSRSRQKLWIKGETSGHVQEVKEIYLDCDGDTLLLKVDQIGGAACHTGFRSCFHRRIGKEGWKIVGERVFDPKEVYEK
jgi:phosphoribosyl-AMP cyclohydrolase